MTAKAWCIKTLLETATQFLEKKGIENPRLNAEVLLAFQLGVKRISLYLNFDQPLTEDEISGYRSLIRRRLKHEPLQYITGIQEFWSLPFRVSPQVLIPRPETEILVEQVIHLTKASNGKSRLRILDLGTGSGIIAIAVAKEMPEAFVVSTDISGEALTLARTNALKHGLKDRILFLQGDLLEPFATGMAPFDLIVSNPPYVRSQEIQGLSPEVADYEPRLALDGGKDGMDYLKRIIARAPRYLRPGGWLLLEMSPNQIEPAIAGVLETTVYQDVKTVEDYSHLKRVVVAQLKCH